MCICLKCRTPSVAQALVSMVTNWAPLRRPTAQTSSKMASFSETLDLAEEEEILFNFTPEEKETTEEKTVVCVPSKPELRGTICGNMFLLIKWETWTRSSTFGFFRCLNIVSMTSYVRLHPISNTKTPDIRYIGRYIRYWNFPTA